MLFYSRMIQKNNEHDNDIMSVNIKDLIAQEIARSGNTNLIADSNLPDKRQIFAVGDSHTIYFYNSMRIKEHWGYLGKIPLTVYTLLRDNMNIYEIGNILGNTHEQYNIKEGDIVLFYYGYNDIQKNIYTYYGNLDWEHEIEKMFLSYIRLLVSYKNDYKIEVIVPCIYPNPREGADVNCFGSLKERENYCLKANKVLKELCAEYNLKFLGIYDLIVDSEGMIKQEYTKDLIHLDYDNDVLRETIEKIIMDLIKV